MRLTYDGINKSNEELYFWTAQLGKLNFDLNATIRLMRKLNDTYIDEDEYLNLFLLERMCINFNEGIKLLIKIDEKIGLDNYITKEFKYEDSYKLIIDEMNFNNEKSFGNRYLKNYRDKSVHYKAGNIDNFKEVIYAMTSKDKLEFDKVFKSDYHIEDKSQVIHLASNIGMSNVTLLEFQLNTAACNNALLVFCTHIIAGISCEVFMSLESDKTL